MHSFSLGTLVQVLAPNIWIYVIARMLTGLFDDCFALCQAYVLLFPLIE